MWREKLGTLVDCPGGRRAGETVVQVPVDGSGLPIDNHTSNGNLGSNLPRQWAGPFLPATPALPTADTAQSLPDLRLWCNPTCFPLPCPRPLTPQLFLR